jgi:hypothetical protein
MEPNYDYSIDQGCVLAWEHPVPDHSPEPVGVGKQENGFYATIIIDGKEYDYSFNCLLHEIFPGQLKKRSHKGRCLYSSPSFAKAATCFLRALDQPVDEAEFTSILEAKSRRLSEEPKMMENLIRRHGTRFVWPGRNNAAHPLADYVWLHFSRFNEDPHLVLVRHGLDYYIGGFKGGAGFSTETGELSPKVPNNMTWRSMLSLDRYCRIWDADGPSIAHGRRIEKVGPGTKAKIC